MAALCEEKRRLKGVAGRLPLLAAVWFAGQSADFQPEVRGQRSVTVVHMPGISGNNQGLSWPQCAYMADLEKETIKTYMHAWPMYLKEMYVLMATFSSWN